MLFTQKQVQVRANLHDQLRDVQEKATLPHTQIKARVTDANKKASKHLPPWVRALLCSLMVQCAVLIQWAYRHDRDQHLLERLRNSSIMSMSILEIGKLHRETRLRPEIAMRNAYVVLPPRRMLDRILSQKVPSSKFIRFKAR